MSRAEEARRFLASWDPDGDDLPDWVADALDEDPSLPASVDARYSPWQGRALALPEPSPPTAKPAEPRRWRRALPALGIMALAAAALLWVGQAPAPEEVQLARLESESTPEVPILAPPATGESANETPDEPSAEFGGRVARLDEDKPSKPMSRPSDVKLQLSQHLPQHLPQQIPQQLPQEIAEGEKDPMMEEVLAEIPALPLGDGEPGTTILQSDQFGPEYWSDELGLYRPAIPSKADSAATGKELIEEDEEEDREEDGEDAYAPLRYRDAPRVDSSSRRRGPLSGLASGLGDALEGTVDGVSRAFERKDEKKVPRDSSLDMFELSPPPPPPPPPQAAVTAVTPIPPVQGTEHYTDYGLNGFVRTAEDALSTFSIDVDTASYTMTRRKLREGYLPPQEAVRVEEFVNYLPYDYERPPDGAPFGVDFLGVPSPFGGDTKIVRVGVQGKRVDSARRQPVHLTFLVDTSGSMQSPDKIDLVKYALKALVGELVDGDTVSIVAYAGSAGLVLPPTSMSQKGEIVRALERLQAGGSTAMGAGIELAYKQAETTYQQGAINRVIILSDGDANVGQTSHEALVELIRKYARKGITLTTAGFGTGNYKDTMMERLANDGDGNYWYIDSEDQARRVFVDQLTSTLVEIARDVKIQVEWNPATVRAYRLLGYENRDIADVDFRNDKVDAGEIGAGHQVTALYELALVEGAKGTLGTVRVRNKAPGPDAPAVERAFSLSTGALRASFPEGDRDLRMAIAAAGLAELLRGSPHFPEMSYRQVASIARGAARPEYPEDAELVDLIERAEKLSGGRR